MVASSWCVKKKSLPLSAPAPACIPGLAALGADAGDHASVLHPSAPAPARAAGDSPSFRGFPDRPGLPQTADTPTGAGLPGADEVQISASSVGARCRRCTPSARRAHFLAGLREMHRSAHHRRESPPVCSRLISAPRTFRSGKLPSEITPAPGLPLEAI